MRTDKQPSDRVGEYRLLQKLDEGSSCTIWRAEQVVTHEVVALKVFSSQAKQFLIGNEARLLYKLKHKNIVEVKGGDLTHDPPYIVLAYMHSSLRHFLQDNATTARPGSTMRFIGSLKTFRSILAGVAYMHSQGVVHNDLKPENVLVGSAGLSPTRVAVCDLGISQGPNPETGVVQSGTTSVVTTGTISYMSPERLSGVDAGYRGDVWSLGLILFELLMGRLPTGEGESIASAYSCQGVIGVQAIYDECRFAHASRYPNAMAVLAVVDQLLGSLPGKREEKKATPLPPRKRRGKEKQRNELAVPVLFLSVVFLTVIVLFLILSREAGERQRIRAGWKTSCVSKTASDRQAPITVPTSNKHLFRLQKERDHWHSRYSEECRSAAALLRSLRESREELATTIRGREQEKVRRVSMGNSKAERELASMTESRDYWYSRCDVLKQEKAELTRDLAKKESMLASANGPQKIAELQCELTLIARALEHEHDALVEERAAVNVLETRLSTAHAKWLKQPQPTQVVHRSRPASLIGTPIGQARKKKKKKKREERSVLGVAPRTAPFVRYPEKYFTKWGNNAEWRSEE